MWPVDAHPDHAAASEIARKAIRLANYAGEFWMIEEGMGQTAHFEPDLCVDISTVLDERDRLIRCHACQNPDDKMVQGQFTVARFRGEKAGCWAAEGFKTLRSRRAGVPSILDKIAVRPG
jgi:LmbE family N-acetylglucosaminyl deacetylase